MLFHSDRLAVHRIVRRALVLATLLTLSGCDWFYQSTFPSYVPLLENQVRVSDRLPYDPAAQYRVECYDEGSTEYVFLLGDGPEIGKVLVIYDSSLNEQYHTKISNSATEFELDDPIVTNDAGEVFVGLLEFGPGLSGPTTMASNDIRDQRETLFDPTPPSLVSLSANGSAVSGRFTPASNRPDSGNMNFFPPPTFDPAGSNFDRMDMGYSILTGIAGMAAFDDAIGMVAGFIGSTALVEIDHVADGSTISTNTGGYSFYIDVYPEEIYIARDGVVVKREDSNGALTFYDVFGAKGDTMRSGRAEHRFAFSIAGEHFYLLEPERGTLAKARTWW